MSQQKISPGRRPNTPHSVIPAKAGISDSQSTEDSQLSPKRLLELYDRVAEAPDAIDRLRDLVLNVALRGKLVEQDSTDESPSKLLDRVRRNLQAMAKKSKRLRWKPTAPVNAEELDKDVPPGWIAARVNDTGLYINGLVFKSADWERSGLPIIRIQNLTDETKEFNYAGGDFPDEVKVRDGDLLVSWSATLDVFRWNRGDAILNQHIFRVIPDNQLTNRDFLFLLLRNAIREMIEGEHAHGLVMKHINRGPFLNHTVLIPPQSEQRRIVNKVEELIGLLNRLETTRTKREATRDRLTTTSLDRLTASDTKSGSFITHARFALDALPALTTRPYQIETLRQTIINLAVRGKLVAQDPSDEPASELLNQIRVERTRRLKAGEIRKQKSPESVHPNERSFSEPNGWAWARLLDIGVTQTGASPSSSMPKFFGEFIPFVKPADLDGTCINCHGPGLSREGMNHSRIAPANSVMMVCIGASLGKVNVTERDVCFNQQINSLTPYLNGMCGFLALALKSSEFQESAWARAGTATLPIISKGKWEVMPIPLPPLAEQQRIVAKVDALLSLCDQLEAALSTVTSIRARLLQTLLHDALTPTIGRYLAAVG